MDLHGFDANQVDPAESRDPIPANWYRCVITASEEKPTKAQTGSYLQLTLEVIEGDYQGRKVFDRLNLNNPNATAVEIAQRTLSSICRAVGVMTPRNSSDLHDKPLMVKVSVKPADGQYQASNEVKEYAEPEKGAAAPAAVASGGASTPPWKRK
jgi:hypothetical protein